MPHASPTLDVIAAIARLAGYGRQALETMHTLAGALLAEMVDDAPVKPTEPPSQTLPVPPTVRAKAARPKRRSAAKPKPKPASAPPDDAWLTLKAALTARMKAEGLNWDALGALVLLPPKTLHNAVLQRKPPSEAIRRRLAHFVATSTPQPMAPAVVNGERFPGSAGGPPGGTGGPARPAGANGAAGPPAAASG